MIDKKKGEPPQTSSAELPNPASCRFAHIDSERRPKAGPEQNTGTTRR